MQIGVEELQHEPLIDPTLLLDVLAAAIGTSAESYACCGWWLIYYLGNKLDAAEDNSLQSARLPVQGKLTLHYLQEGFCALHKFGCKAFTWPLQAEEIK